MVKEPKDLTNPILKNAWLLPTDGRNQGVGGRKGKKEEWKGEEERKTTLYFKLVVEKAYRAVEENHTHKTFALFIQE